MMARRRKIVVDQLKAQLVSEGWRTPDTWDGDHLAALPPSPGIYLLVAVNLYEVPALRHIAYAGKSLDLSKRLKAHSVIREIQERDGNWHVERWFRELPAAWIGRGEIEAIRQFDPPLNVQHRKRDLRDWHCLVGGVG